MIRRWIRRAGVVALVLGAAALVLPSVISRTAGGGGDGLGDRDAPSTTTRIEPTQPTSVLFVPRAGADVAAIARRHGLDPATLGAPGAAGEYRAEVPYGDADRLVAALRSDADVAAAQGPSKVVPFEVPDDDGYNQRDWTTLFDGRKQWALRRINPEKAWDDPAVRKDDAGLLVVVADTGVDGDHPDLRLGAAGPAALNDPRQPSYPDEPKKAYHGTAVAGTIAALSDNGKGVASPAWEQTVASWNLFASGDAVGGYRWALEQAGVSKPDNPPKRVVYNGSYGRCDEDKNSCDLEGYSIEADLLRAGIESGRVLWVFSAANEDIEGAAFPARYPYAVAVAATNTSDDKASFSNYGAGVDIAAPGETVFTTKPNEKYGYVDGTSFSAPLVSGVAAAIWKREPLLTSAQVMKRLLASTGESHSDELGYGLVDMDNAFALDQTPPTVKVERKTAAAGTGLTVGFRVVDDLDARGLDPIDESFGLFDAEDRSWRLDFSQVPTSAIDAVKWSIDGGTWHEIAVNRSDVQQYPKVGDGPCQVCGEINVPAEELALVGEHRLVVRAWDSSPKTDAKFGEAVFTFTTDNVPNRGDGTSTALLVDRSGSMSETFQQTTKILAAKLAAGSFLDLVGQAQQIGGRHAAAVVAFSDSATVRPALTSDTAALKAAVEALSAGGGTDIGSAIRDGLAEVSRGVGARTMLLLSDGLPTSGMTTDQILNGPVAEAQRQGIPINTIAVGETAESNRPFLEEIARRTKGVASVASTPSELVFRYLSAEHRTSGVVLYEGRAPAAEIPVPRLAASLRVSVFTATGNLPAVSVVSPSGVRYPIDAVPSSVSAPASSSTTSTTARSSTSTTLVPSAAGGGGVGQLSLPSPLAGPWRFEASQPVNLIVSVQPPTEEKARSATVTAEDPEPPAVVGKVSSPVRPVTRPVQPHVFRTVGGGVMALGAVLLLLGRVVPTSRRSRNGQARAPMVLAPAEVELLEAPPVRAQCCAACGQAVAAGSLFCGNCGRPVDPGLRIDVRGGPDRGRSFLARPGDVIGRADSATVRLADAAVSRRHAQLLHADGEWRVVDLGSSGGTSVNGSVGPEHVLQIGDQIVVGQSSLLVRGTES